jgi:hypothetical protein
MSEVLDSSLVTSYQVDQTNFPSTIILESLAQAHGGGGEVDRRGAVGPNSKPSHLLILTGPPG